MAGSGRGAGAGWWEAVGQVDTHPTDLASFNHGGFSDARLSVATGLVGRKQANA